MTSGFGSLPRVMCVLLDLFTSGLGPKSLDQEGNHMFVLLALHCPSAASMVPECVPAFVS